MIFNQSGGSASPTLQTKTVSPSPSSQLIVPDAGFDALSQVTVNAAPLQAKTATIGSSQTIIKPDSGQYGLSQVTVPAAALQSKTVTPSSSYQTITPSSGYYGLSSVGVSAALLQTKRVVATNDSQYISADPGYYGLQGVYVNPPVSAAVISRVAIDPSYVSSTSMDIALPDFTSIMSLGQPLLSLCVCCEGARNPGDTDIQVLWISTALNYGDKLSRANIVAQQYDGTTGFYRYVVVAPDSSSSETEQIYFRMNNNVPTMTIKTSRSAFTFCSDSTQFLCVGAVYKP